MASADAAYKGLANLNLWLKIRTGDELYLSDLPEIIPLRWTLIRDNWEFMKKGVENAADRYDNPDYFYEQIIEFTAFVQSQRVSSKKINPFSDAMTLHKFYPIFDNLAIRSVALTNEEERIISTKTSVIKNYSKNNFLSIKQALIDYRDQYTDTVGLGDNTYNAAVKKSGTPAQLTATIVDVNTILTIQNGIKTSDFILANLFAVDSALDPFALARANANNPAIDIGQYSSGHLVKINYGESLQSLAGRYLGDPNKWIDIAIANGLKPPYIDEIGIRLSLLSNGNGNQINVSQTDINGNLNIGKFYINQVLFLQSNTQVFPDQRVITSIRQIPVSGEIILELDGQDDLDKYKVFEAAYLRVYQPNTVNSSFFILIPSTGPLAEGRRDDVPWFLAKSPESERRAKVDFAIDDNGELNFGTNGDLKLSFGLANAIQAIRIKMLTELGSLAYHRDFGLVNIIGNRSDDIEGLRTLLIESVNTQIETDTRFDRVESITVEQTSGINPNSPVGISVSLVVKLAGSQQTIPISFTVSY